MKIWKITLSHLGFDWLQQDEINSVEEKMVINEESMLVKLDSKDAGNEY